MKITAKITGITHVNEIDSYWVNKDFVELLKLFDYADAEQVSVDELKDMLYMSMTDSEPEEAAEIVLTYKLSEQLNAGQIQSIAHEMRDDKVAEEYPEPELHYDLFNINQLLYKAFNGTFPNTEATIIEIEANSDGEPIIMTEEIMTKLIGDGLSDKSILNRLYGDQVKGEVAFDDAAKFIWRLDKKGSHSYELLTSRYWVEKEDFERSEYESKIVFYEED